MTAELLLLGDDLAYLASLSTNLRAVSRVMVLQQDAPDPLREAISSGLGQPLAAIICLTGLENVADLRTLMAANPATTFLFLSASMPPRAAMAHAIHDCGGEIVSRKESNVVIAAHLITMLASSRLTA